LATVDIVAASILDIAANIGKLGTHVLLATTKLRCVNGDEETLTATLFGVLDDAFCDIPVFVDL
jgi:hypothetical protein